MQWAEYSDCLFKHIESSVKKSQENNQGTFSRVYSWFGVNNGKKLLSEQISVHIKSSKVYEASRQLQKALNHGQKALDKAKILYGESPHWQLSWALSRLGSVLQVRNELNSAERYSNQALIMDKTLYGEGDNLAVSADLNNLALVLEKQGDLTTAKQYLEQSLEMKQRLYDKNDHRRTIITLCNLGDTLRRYGDLTKAKQYLEQSLAMAQRLYGDVDHLRIAEGLYWLGILLVKQGDLMTAASHLWQSAEMKQRIYGEIPHWGDRWDALSAFFFHMGLMDLITIALVFLPTTVIISRNPFFESLIKTTQNASAGISHRFFSKALPQPEIKPSEAEQTIRLQSSSSSDAGLIAAQGQRNSSSCEEDIEMKDTEALAVADSDIEKAKHLSLIECDIERREQQRTILLNANLNAPSRKNEVQIEAIDKEIEDLQANYQSLSKGR
jgi:tetratricopeptide (TPR) repeat protein